MLCIIVVCVVKSTELALQLVVAWLLSKGKAIARIASGPKNAGLSAVRL